MKLGEAMIKEGLITNEVLARALERQIIFGGRLGTNLVEMGAVTEESLASFLSKVLGVPYAGPENFENIPQEVMDVFPVELASKYTAFPIKKERSRLHLAMKDPNDIATLDEIRFIVGLDIRPYIASEIRILYALEKYYGIKRDLRYVALLEDEKERDAALSRGMAGMVDAPIHETAAEEIEEEPEDVSAPEMQPPVIAAPPPPIAPPKPAPPQPVAEKAPAPPAPAPPPKAEPKAEPKVEPKAPPAAPPPPVQQPPEKAAPPAAKRSPYEVLASPSNRDEIARAVVEAAGGELARAVLFLVKGNAVSGWKACGNGINNDIAAGIALSMDKPSIVKEVVEEKTFYKGPVLTVEQNVVLLDALGGGQPLEAIAYPLIIKGKVVGVLYGDGGKDSLIKGDVGRLRGLMSKASMSLEILILKTKILET